MNEKRKVVLKRSRKSVRDINPTKRLKRIPKKPERYGMRRSASDRDTFFEQLSTDSDDTNHVRSSPAKTPSAINLIESSESFCETITSGSSSDETSNRPATPLKMNDAPTPERSGSHCEMLSKLDEILKRISAIEKNTAKIETRLKHMENTSIEVAETIDDGSDLIDFGIPVNSKSSLDDLEKKLNSDEFRKNMVETIFCFVQY